MTILELNTGLFPDADTVAEAMHALEGLTSVTRMDITGLSPDDEDGWGAVATAILAADLVVTL